MKLKDNIEISGMILGVKGPILFLERTGATYSLNLNSLVGRKISKNQTSSSLSQSGLGVFMKRLRVYETI
jgi:hypothetical protein